MTLNRTDVTYCTGLWLIPGNEKRSDEHYFRLISKTCELIASQRLVLHCSDAAVEEHFRNGATAHGIDLRVVAIGIDELPFSHYAPALVESCSRMALVRRPDELGREKGIVHYWRDLRGSGASVYRQMIAIWLSKIPLACTVLSSLSGESNAVAWIDSSIGRIKGRRTNWNFQRIKPVDGKVQHYTGRMTFEGRPLSVSAGFLQADHGAWSRLLKLFETTLKAHLHDDYGHDDETILSFCEAAEPTLFRAVGRPIGPFRRRLQPSFRSAPVRLQNE